MRPQVAILMSTYNGEDYIREQLDSIFAQTYDNFLLYIRDDGSKDSTIQIIREYELKYQGKIIILKDQLGNLGAYRSFLTLMQSVEAEYYMLADQDDLWKSNKVSQSIDLLISEELKFGKDKPICVFCDAEVVDENLNPICDSLWRYVYSRPEFAKDVYALVVYQIPAYGCLVAFNSITLKRCLARKHLIDRILHDALIVYTAAYEGVVAYIEEPLMKYRRHSRNVSDSHALTLKLNDIKKDLIRTPFIIFQKINERYKLLKDFGVKDPSRVKILKIFIERFTKNKSLYM